MDNLKVPLKFSARHNVMSSQVLLTAGYPFDKLLDSSCIRSKTSGAHQAVPRVQKLWQAMNQLSELLRIPGCRVLATKIVQNEIIKSIALMSYPCVHG